MTSDFDMLLGILLWIFGSIGLSHCTKSLYRAVRGFLVRNPELIQKGLGVEAKGPSAT